MEQGQLSLAPVYLPNGVSLVAALPGDATLDGMIGILDLGELANNYGKDHCTWSQGDFNGDTLVNILDLAILANKYSTTGASLPEPATLAILGAGALLALRRRRA
jgi:hypothetical protein